MRPVVKNPKIPVVLKTPKTQTRTDYLIDTFICFQTFGQSVFPLNIFQRFFQVIVPSSDIFTADRWGVCGCNVYFSKPLWRTKAEPRERAFPSSV